MGLTYLPQSGVAPTFQAYDGDTPEMVKRKREMADALFGKATSAAPLQHWMQALAQGVQGVSSGMLRNQADEGEKRGNASLTQALMGNGSAQDKMGALARTPWGLPTAMDLAKKPIESDLVSGGTAMGKLQLEKLQTEVENAKRNQAIDEAMLGEVGFPLPPKAGGAPPVQQQPQMPQTVPQGGLPAPVQPRPMPASAPGISVGAAPAGMPGAAPAAPQAAAPQKPPLTGGFIQQILATRSPAEQKAWVLQFRANKEKAVEKLYEWADPLKKQEDKRQMEVGEAQGKRDAENLPHAAQTVTNITKGLEELASIPSRYGGDKGVFTSAVGPFAGDPTNYTYSGVNPGAWARGLAQTGGSISSHWATGANASAPPAEVRRAIQGATDTLASVLKPLIRKPGEGTWSDQDQARLDMIMGNLTQVRDEAGFRRELGNIRSRINANFNMNLPEIGAKAPPPPPTTTGATAAAAPPSQSAAPQGAASVAPVDWNRLEKTKQRTAVQRLASKYDDPSAHEYFKAQFGNEAYEQAKAMAEKLRKSIAY